MGEGFPAGEILCGGNFHGRNFSYMTFFSFIFGDSILHLMFWVNFPGEIFKAIETVWKGDFSMGEGFPAGEILRGGFSTGETFY